MLTPGWANKLLFFINKYTETDPGYIIGPVFRHYLYLYNTQ